MFCVRREDRESEWLAFVTQNVAFRLYRAPKPLQFDTPQPWPLHDAVEYVNQNRAEDYPVAVYRFDEEDSETYPTHKVYPSAEMQRVNA